MLAASERSRVDHVSSFHEVAKLTVCETLRRSLMHQMLSLRSLAFILASAMRRARALSCASFQCFPEMIERKIATKTATKIEINTAAMMQSPASILHLSCWSRSERRGPFLRRALTLPRRIRPRQAQKHSHSEQNAVQPVQRWIEKICGYRRDHCYESGSIKVLR